MIEYTSGNIFESGADCLINAVNCEGVMGKGIAYQFKLKFPENNKSYIKACKSSELTIGKVHYFTENGITIVNLPTKNKWREKSKIEYIKTAMDYFVDILPKLQVKNIAIPPLGCGNGGLNWKDVKKVIECKLENISDKYNFIISEPAFSSKSVITKKPGANIASLILLDIRLNLKRFNNIRLHKTCYFLNFFLKEEYFKFDKWKLGPYSSVIDTVAKDIKEYQEYYGIDDAETTFDEIYKVICSERVSNEFNRLHIAVQKSAEYVNVIQTDKKLDCITLILYLIQTGCLQNREQLIENLKCKLEDKVNKFSDKYIFECIEYLESTSIISKDINGNYFIGD